MVFSESGSTSGSEDTSETSLSRETSSGDEDSDSWADALEPPPPLTSSYAPLHYSANTVREGPMQRGSQFVRGRGEFYVDIIRCCIKMMLNNLSMMMLSNFLM